MKSAVAEVTDNKIAINLEELYNNRNEMSGRQ